jgi:hypothetical protein
VLEEALRVSRAKVVVIEDTPSTAFDRLMNHRHGESYRRKIGSTAAFGFLTEGEWRWLFRGMGLEPESPAAVALLPLDPAAVRAHRVRAAEVAHLRARLARAVEASTARRSTIQLSDPGGSGGASGGG